MQAKFTSTVNPRIRTLPQLMKLDQRDMGTMLGIVDLEFTRNEKRLFSTEGTSGGRAWKPLSTAYARAKARAFPGRKIMQRTGKLRQGLTQQSHADHVKFTKLKPRATITVGTDNQVAAFHIPARDTLQHTPRQERKYYALVSDYLVNVKLARVKRVLAAWKGRRRGAA